MQEEEYLDNLSQLQAEAFVSDAREFMALRLTNGREVNAHVRAGTQQEFVRSASFLERAERLKALRGTLVSDREALLDSGVEAQRFEGGRRPP